MRLVFDVGYQKGIVVSIHALLAECDRPIRETPRNGSSFNPRTPCGVRRLVIGIGIGILPRFNPRTPCGVRLISTKVWDTRAPFQSTHSLRSATGCVKSVHQSGVFQSTHSLRSATSWDFTPASTHRVSIHALLAECDQLADYFAMRDAEFQSTHSLRSATVLLALTVSSIEVSIHALLAECDIESKA